MKKPAFWKVAVKDILRIGAIVPSSRWIIEGVIKRLPTPLNTIVEYGCGTGTITRELLPLLPQHGKLIGFELHPDFAKGLESITDPRFQLKHGNVVHLSQHLREETPQGVDVAISGIPFTFHSEEELHTIFKNTHAGLRTGGRFIVYQVSVKWRRYFEQYFGNVQIDFEPRNIPPYFILTGIKE